MYICVIESLLNARCVNTSDVKPHDFAAQQVAYDDKSNNVFL